MTMYPEVQKKAQEEIDRVVGHIRLPTFEDRVDLPYIDCIIKETLRWYPAVPLGSFLFHYPPSLLKALISTCDSSRFTSSIVGR